MKGQWQIQANQRLSSEKKSTVSGCVLIPNKGGTSQVVVRVVAFFHDTGAFLSLGENTYDIRSEETRLDFDCPYRFPSYLQESLLSPLSVEGVKERLTVKEAWEYWLVVTLRAETEEEKMMALYRDI